jgi:hypothetical protein
MPDNPTENPAGREGENYDETMSEDLLDEDELDPEEAERRITQFVTSADELPGPPVEELAERVTALMRRSCERHRATSRRSWMGWPTTRYSPRNSCWVSELADGSRTTQDNGTSTRQARY